jgi:hypothetical protein
VDRPRQAELLEQVGIDILIEQLDHPVRTECLRTAQRLHATRRRAIGLLPASADVGVVGIGVNLAIALAELTGSTVGYVDANVRWPALAGQIEAQDVRDPTPDAPFMTRWLRGDVALLIPRGGGAGGAGLATLRTLLANANEIFSTCLVDLTGWKRLGEHLPAFALLDGVIVVARAGLTTEDELLRLRHEIPAERHLGVLLIGARPDR